jgi:hypothetical protein
MSLSFLILEDRKVKMAYVQKAKNTKFIDV